MAGQRSKLEPGIGPQAPRQRRCHGDCTLLLASSAALSRFAKREVSKTGRETWSRHEPQQRKSEEHFAESTRQLAGVSGLFSRRGTWEGLFNHPRNSCAGSKWDDCFARQARGKKYV
jgi:hypothetical protein